MKRSSAQRRRILFWILSVVVAVSMICSLVATLAPPRQRVQPTSEPTYVIPTWTPTSTPTPPQAATPVPSAPSAPETPTAQP